MTLRSKLWGWWTHFTGAFQALDASRKRAYIDRRDLCQNFNQLESTVTDLRRDTKKRNDQLESAIKAARERMAELMEDRLRVQRESLMDARQENLKLVDEVAGLKEEIELMQNRLAHLESPAVEKIGG